MRLAWRDLTGLALLCRRPTITRPNTVADVLGDEFIVYIPGCEEERKGSSEPRKAAPLPAIVHVAARICHALAVTSST